MSLARSPSSVSFALGGSEHLGIMNTLKIILSEFWLPFIGVSVAVSGVWLLRRSVPDARLLLLNRKAFAELVGYSKEEQRLFAS